MKNKNIQKIFAYLFFAVCFFYFAKICSANSFIQMMPPTDYASLEEALIGTDVADAEKPLEVMRVVHSFDPCLACTVHVIHPESNRIMDFKVS